jgi:hypothetical protein
MSLYGGRVGPNKSTVAEAEEQKSRSRRAVEQHRSKETHTTLCIARRYTGKHMKEMSIVLGWAGYWSSHTHSLSLSLYRDLPLLSISQAFSFFLSFFLSLPSHSLDGCNGHTTKLRLSSSSLLGFCLLYGIQCHQQHFFLSRVVCVCESSLLERCTTLSAKETPLAHIVQHS